MPTNPGVPRSTILYMIAINIVLLALIAWVFGDRAYRDEYWRSMGFTPTTSYSPFFYITSAVNGSTYIQGQLTLDWTQVLGALLVIIDVVFVIGVIRGRRRARAGTTAPPSQVGAV